MPVTSGPYGPETETGAPEDAMDGPGIPVSVPVGRRHTSSKPVPLRFGGKALRWTESVVDPLIRRGSGCADREPPASDRLPGRVPTLTALSDIRLDPVVLG